jgi:hypothetical protein
LDVHVRVDVVGIILPRCRTDVALSDLLRMLIAHVQILRDGEKSKAPGAKSAPRAPGMEFGR